MKTKIFICVLIFAILLLTLVSCRMHPYDTTESVSTESTVAEYSHTTALFVTSDDGHNMEETTDTTASPDPISTVKMQDEGFASYNLTHGSVDMEDFVLFNYSGTMRFYDRETEEFYRFCYDPSCNHRNWQQCISLRFVMDGLTGFQMPRYSEYDDRFYYLRGQKLCSFATDGSDLVIEYSFGDEGDFERYVYNCMSVLWLSTHGKYAFMIQQGDVPERRFWRYDMETDTMTQLLFPSGDAVSYYRIFDHALYIGVGTKIYRTNFEFTEFEDITEYVETQSFLYDSVYRNGWCYYEKDNEMLYRYHPETKVSEHIYTYTGDGNVTYHAVTDSYAYCSVNIGILDELTGDTEDGDIYRIDLESGEAELAFRFSDHFFDFEKDIMVFDIHFLNENTVLVYAQYETNDEVRSDGFIMTVDENGIFRDASMMEMSKSSS